MQAGGPYTIFNDGFLKIPSTTYSIGGRGSVSRMVSGFNHRRQCQFGFPWVQYQVVEVIFGGIIKVVGRLQVRRLAGRAIRSYSLELSIDTLFTFSLIAYN